jgi:hypothetical protein
MTISEYYNVLGIHTGSSVDEIKKAYRKRARECHPDINSSPGAKDLFISATEAYEFLISYHEKIISDEEAYKQAMEDWRKYRQDRSRQRAKVYAQTSFSHFKNTNFYKTTRIFDGTTIIFSLIVSIIVLVATVWGYIMRIRHPVPGLEDPSVIMLVILLLFGMVLFVVSFIHLKVYLESSQKHKQSI